jgi:ABC-2 type transport system permease protein
MQKNKLRFNTLSNTLFILTILVLLNIVSKGLHFRIDLTKEKRYTLSEETSTILENLNDIVFIRVYLSGDLNIQLLNFQKSVLEMLDEFRVYAGKNIQYELSDPFEGADNKARVKILEELYNKGLRPVNIHNRKKDGSVTEKIIIPGVTISYNGIEVPLNLLLNDPSKTSEENLNNSVESLEYTLISTIKNITSNNVEKVAFIDGHGEWPDPFVSDMMHELSNTFQVDRGTISGMPGILDPYACIIIAGPVSKFNEADKYVIDQYIMQGGKVLWLIDAVNVDFDSLANGMTVALPNELNLDDMLFRYGARINPDLIRDAQCGALKVNVALAGNEPNFQLAPWLYYPVITPNKDHIITNNLNMVLARFASTIDTLEGRKGIKKTALLQTSDASDRLETPAIIQLEEINKKPTAEELNQKNLITGILLEGEFESVFKNRMIDNYFEKIPTNTLQKSKPTKMAIIADADIIRNDIIKTDKGPSILPLGFDRSTNQTYGNKDFLLNVISYLTDDSNLLQLRGREFKLRLLNQLKLNRERLKWQIINLLLPVLLVIIIGLFYTMYRKHIYTR